MPNAGPPMEDLLTLEDLILSSRALSVEEKQELIKKIDTLPQDKREKIREALKKEFVSFKRFNELQNAAIKEFTQDLQNISSSIPS